MSPTFPCAIPAAIATIPLLSAFQAAAKPEDDFAALAKAYLAMGLPTDWEGIEKLPGFKWAPQETELKNCLPNGDCYARQGTAAVGGKNLSVVASGARTMVMNLLIRNMSAPFGGPAVVAALERAGLTVELARCPVRGGSAATSWYRLKGDNLSAAVLSIQPPATGRPNEGFVVSRGEELPALQPNQLALYTERCAPGAERKPVSTVLPHESLAQAVVALLVPAGGAPLYDWKALAALPTEVRWLGEAPKPANLASLGDPNPMMLSGEVIYGGRKFSVMATGTATEVKAIHLEEMGLHPRGEHMLGEVYKKGIAVRLVRCGPVYTESTNNWYSLTSVKTRPASILQSIRYDGSQVQDSYKLRLDGTLPARDPRDRDPGRNGC
jgi:hypothetical protein